MTEENKDLTEELDEAEEVGEDSKEEEAEVNSAEDERLEALEEEKKELTDKLLRLQADFSNYKKRAEKDRKNTINFAVEGFVSDLLPIIDNFQRAMESQEDKEDAFYKGVSLIYENLNSLLENNGVAEMDCLGEDFDPNKHHAVLMEEVEDSEEGKVLAVLQTGYTMKDKVIRPAMVKVSK